MSRRPVVAVVAVLAALAAACAGGDTGTATGGVDLERDPRDRVGPTAPTTVAEPTAPAPADGSPEGACPPPPARRGPPATRPRYDLGVEVDLAADEVRGTQTVRFEPDLRTDRLVLRLWPNGPRPAGAGARLHAGDVMVDGAPVPTALPDPTTLVVDLGAEVPAGRALELSLAWRLELPGPVNDRVARTGEAVRLGSFFPILAWVPGRGWATEPPTSGFAEASVAPTADFTVEVTVPDGLDVLATGVPRGDGVWHARAVRDFALSVGRFRTAEGTARAPHPVRVTVGVHETLPDDPADYLARVVAVLEELAGRYGRYQWPVYTLALTPDLSGGIEYPTHVMQGPGTSGRTTSHEVAHQWFYALVGSNQATDPWLDEGLATWAEAQVEGTLERFVRLSLPPAAQGRLGAPMAWWEQHPRAYYRGVYVQGAVALAELGAPHAVDCALAHYVARRAHSVASPADLLDALEAVFPEAEAVLGRRGALP